ncbi:MAG: NAD(P)H-dependent oxidoreductase subunit E [Candidatus Coatesbacteria bacterium]|nr:NAD(P)H-dependent oxidoreductase subunit E [Candidatus Coatesbacteria bacterium]
MSQREVDEIIEGYDCKRSALIAILQDIQTEYRHLPEHALRRVAQRLNMPLSEVYSTATFFKSFSLTPRKPTVCVCLGTACHVRGATLIYGEVQRRFDTSEWLRNNYQIESVNCLGACALAPIVVVDGKYHGHMTIKKLNEILPAEMAQ